MGLGVGVRWRVLRSSSCSALLEQSAAVPSKGLKSLQHLSFLPLATWSLRRSISLGLIFIDKRFSTPDQCVIALCLTIVEGKNTKNVHRITIQKNEEPWQIWKKRKCKVWQLCK